MEDKHLSTTALAKSIGKEPKELFILLAQGKWIIKLDGHWCLTEKGKFEGGITIDHPRYGPYIAWPESIKQHVILQELPEAPLTATNLAHKLSLPARQVNLLLAERGWIRKGIKGWLLTEQGRALGAQQQTSEKSGIPYVSWPESLLQQPLLLEMVAALAADEPGCALDGHSLASGPLLKIDNWLYLTGINHGIKRRLPTVEQAWGDFYLPEFHVYIEYWGSEQDSEAMAAKLAKRELYQQHKLAVIELTGDDMAQLDEVLPRLLLEHGLAVY